MKLKQLKEIENANFNKIRTTLTKEDRLLLSCKNNFINKKIDFLKSYYYKRNKLIDQGEINYVYCFKEYEYEEDCPISKVIGIFSLSSQIEEIDLINAKKKLDEIDIKTNRKLFNLLHNKYADFLYLNIEEETGLKDGYISMLTRYKSIIPDFTLGLNPVISSKGISKEMILLPPKFRVKSIDK